MAGRLIEDDVLAELVQEKDRSTDSYGQGGGLAGMRKPTSQVNNLLTPSKQPINEETDLAGEKSCLHRVLCGVCCVLCTVYCVLCAVYCVLTQRLLPSSQISSSSTTRPPLGGRGGGSGDVRLRTKGYDPAEGKKQPINTSK